MTDVVVLRLLTQVGRPKPHRKHRPSQAFDDRSNCLARRQVAAADLCMALLRLAPAGPRPAQPVDDRAQVKQRIAHSRLSLAPRSARSPGPKASRASATVVPVALRCDDPASQCCHDSHSSDPGPEGSRRLGASSYCRRMRIPKTVMQPARKPGKRCHRDHFVRGRERRRGQGSSDWCRSCWSGGSGRAAHEPHLQGQRAPHTAAACLHRLPSAVPA